MKGYPKHLNSRADYEYVMSNFPRDKWYHDVMNLLDTMYGWDFIKDLESADTGITDETHKVVEQPQGEMGEIRYAQYELRINPMCKLLRLGFTEQEVRAFVAAS